ncbi:MAG: alpha/beta fold hydrolase [Phycisphaerales bacterium]|nr:alpha/beta fold hydrolase [Phycisphaerales bacterium]
MATGGSDQADGSAAHPVATLERARDLVRAIRRAAGPRGKGTTGAGGAAVVTLHAGTYELVRAFELSTEDGGTEGSPIIYQAALGAEVRISGGRRVNGWKPVTDPAVLARLDPVARGRVVQADLRAMGVTDFGTMGGGFGKEGGPGLELFFRDQPQTISRYPNEDFITIADVLGETDIKRPRAKARVEGIITYDEREAERLARWKDETEPWALGYWLHDWAEERQKIASIDPAARRITLAPPNHHYGYRQGGWFYGFNLLCEIDRPGEWFLDRAAGVIFFWPPDAEMRPIKDGEAVVSVLDSLVTLSSAEFVTFRGLTFEHARGTAFRMEKAKGNRVEDCTLRNIGSWAVSIRGEESGVHNCEITGTGDGGVSLGGGDRKTLTPGRLTAENNHIHHWSRWNRMNRQGIALSGVGNRAAHNLLHDSPHTAIVFSGNDHAIEFNEIHDVCKESNDAGAIYAGRDWTGRGNVIRHNFLHHLSGFKGGRAKGCIGIYLDDMFSGVTITGNIFYDVTMAAYIGGGMDNRVENNLFIDCKPAVHVDARGLGWAHKWSDDWLREVKEKGTLTGIRFDQPPYSERYPELATLMTRTPPPPAPTGNIIGRNIQFGGTWSDFENGSGSLVTIEHNLLGVDPLFVDAAARTGASAGAFRLRDDSPAFKAGAMGEEGYQRIPVEKIGRQRPGASVMIERKQAVQSGHAPVNGLRLYYEVHGAAHPAHPPLVLLHGGGDTIDTNFRLILPLLARDRQVIAFEQQGYGHTADIADRPFSFEQSADDTAALLAYLHVDKADLFGFSNGGTIALQVAIRHPKVVHRLVLASTLASRDGAYPWLWEMLAKARLEDMPKELQAAYLKVAPHPENLRMFHDKAAQRMRDFKDIPADAIRGITAPALVVIGDADVIRPEHAADLFRALPHAQMAVLPGTDHMNVTAHTDWLAPMITGFLDAATTK